MPSVCETTVELNVSVVKKLESDPEGFFGVQIGVHGFMYIWSLGPKKAAGRKDLCSQALEVLRSTSRGNILECSSWWYLRPKRSAPLVYLRDESPMNPTDEGH